MRSVSYLLDAMPSTPFARAACQEHILRKIRQQIDFVIFVTAKLEMHLFIQTYRPFINSVNTARYRLLLTTYALDEIR